MDKENTLRISLLGGLKIEYGENHLAVGSSRTKQVWSLLGYLVCHRFVEISADKFIEVLWPNEEIDNPSNALKNLVYRLRVALNRVGRTQDREYVLFKHGSYGWNNEIPCIIDTEEMERFAKLGDNTTLDADTRASNYSHALSLYEGEFLSSAVYDEWAVSIRSYYRKLYVECVLKLCKILMELERYQEIEEISSIAISFEPFEESLHEYYLNALIKRNKFDKAIEHYNYISALFYKELGVNLSQKIRSIYRDILICYKKAETDFAVVIKELQESDRAYGAYLCDYEIFKNIYRIMARSIVRTGYRPYFGLLTVINGKGEIPNERFRERIMDNLREVIINGLRKGDVVSRYSSTQYMILFQTTSKETAQSVLNRICTGFNSIYIEDKSAKVEAKTFIVEAIP